MRSASADESKHYPPIEGTRKEINKTNELLRGQGVKPLLLTDEKASEDAVRLICMDSTKSPTILHFATHGDYRQTKFRLTPQQALHNNFLLFANCNRTTEEHLPPIGNLNDGVLTAAEIAQMDLSGTQLVVLSACQTALGDVRGGEGVFGLARGFKLAGAKYRLVSLWSVDDTATAEFMELFYKTWIGGKTIPEAFYATQTAMRKKHSVKDWAAWVLVK